ncbi:GerAB/ArcD/ProY family transporter [Domibacillus sp. DTU_2020_1001157_1_SI_ALB_TIR_016]|uniref:GerAB/ArcD/ProY family transporter n=1 Tax=Domibacillus sp. DTU_2020_1001157_1_SI_ALB_TIR_016 TaxID=3077789 RepID=UPI0028E9881B|nr:GerAB/ArcD/ProY family transporter [Domibacillus sp. DTU_2020_1001157_1_SI_ALB_TIR_016]WNS81334.1 GerAB/ArcD/ProY family transporter [Domibacillus sp. DTU_2020_1001157_1_SI_ALB_TIR_016]
MGGKVKRGASISTWQLFFFLLQTQVGVGILTLPYEVHQAAGKDGWLSVLLAGLFIQIGIFVIWLLACRFPEKTLADFSPLLIGRVFSIIIVTLYTLFFFMVASQVLAVFLSITADWAFPRTPSVVFAVIITALTIYLVQEDVRVIARFHVLMSFLLIGVLLVFLLMWNYLNVYYLFPIGSSGFKAILSGSQQALFALNGIEVLLWLFPFTQAENKKKWQAAAGASLVVTVIYTLLALCAFAYFSTTKLTHVPEPVLYMIKSIELGIVERLDLIFLSLWAVVSITTFMSYLYVAGMGAAKVVNAKHHKKSIYVLGALIVPLAVYTSNAEAIKTLGRIIGTATTVFLFVIPLFLLLVAIIRRKREGTG